MVNPLFIVQAFRDAGHQWTQALCMADSDGDGMTNGQELGDNDCSWTPSNGRALGSVKGHPGVYPFSPLPTTTPHIPMAAPWAA